MRILFAALTCALVSGCGGNPYAQLEQQAKQAAHYEAVTTCDQPERSSEWKDNCYKMVMYRRQNEFIASVRQDQAQRQAAYSQSLLAASSALAASAPPPPQPMPIARPVNCTSYGVGGTVQTNCR